MLTSKQNDFITIKTNYDGMFLVTIRLKSGEVIYKESMCSNNQQILLEGFSLQEHSVTVTSLINDNNLKSIIS